MRREVKWKGKKMGMERRATVIHEGGEVQEEWNRCVGKGRVVSEWVKWDMRETIGVMGRSSKSSSAIHPILLTPALPFSLQSHLDPHNHKAHLTQQSAQRGSNGFRTWPQHCKILEQGNMTLYSVIIFHKFYVKNKTHHLSSTHKYIQCYTLARPCQQHSPTNPYTGAKIHMHI